MIKEEIKDENLPSEATNLIVDNPKCAPFYLRPKIHKTNNPGRPIVSNCSFPTERVSKYLDEILNPIVENLGTYVKDSTRVLNIFENLKYRQPQTNSIHYGYGIIIYSDSSRRRPPLRNFVLESRTILELFQNILKSSRTVL